MTWYLVRPPAVTLNTATASVPTSDHHLCLQCCIGTCVLCWEHGFLQQQPIMAHTWWHKRGQLTAATLTRPTTCISRVSCAWHAWLVAVRGTALMCYICMSRCTSVLGRPTDGVPPGKPPTGVSVLSGASPAGCTHRAPGHLSPAQPAAY
jgi:hypothetical protein